MNQSSNPIALADFLDLVAERLHAAGVHCGHGTDNVFDEGVWLTLHALGDSPVNPSSDAERQLSPTEQAQVWEWVERRISTRKPTAYLTQTAWFAGLEFYVDERVLVPRSPLAELIHAEFAPWYLGAEPRRILDLCTGSGCIAIACATQFPDAQVDACDLSAEALAVAEINRQKHGLEARLELALGDLFKPFSGRKYDIIVSNPPYVSHQEMVGLASEFKAEPQLGFDGGEDGMRLVAQILQNAGRHLNSQGLLVVEVGDPEVVEATFPDLAFTWPEFAAGGEGVFVLQAEQLQEYDPKR